MSWYPPASKPIPADGIKARSQRGQIGETWWSGRFIAILESFNLGTRLHRGRNYARRGQVLSFDVAPGLVSAEVQGSRVKPYKVKIQIGTFTDGEWDRAEAVMASRAVFLAKLLAGEMPQQIADAFVESKLSMLPSSARDLDSSCSCPDYSNPCKHIAATYYLLAEAFDDDPFLIFRWRGRDRDVFLRSLRGASPPPPPDARPLDPSTFWTAAKLPRLTSQPSVPGAVLRELAELDIHVRGRPLIEFLSPAYDRLSD